MIEEKNPDKVNPTEDWDDQTEDDTKNVLSGRLLNDGCDTDEDFDDPVDKRNEKKNDLNKSRLFVKPTHKCNNTSKYRKRLYAKLSKKYSRNLQI